MKLYSRSTSPVITAFWIQLILAAATVSFAAENQWTWIKGHNERVTTGVYGQIGVPAEANTPPGTGFAAQWVTPDGNTWIYGGAGNYNTVWKFHNSTRNWAWMDGTSTPISAQPVYGIKGEEAPANSPGSRIKMISWADQSGNLWLYGGVANNVYADLWKFNTLSLQWTWVHGSNQSNQPAVYGTKGIAAESNTPGSRYGSAAWVDDSGNFWLFGGLGFSSSFGWLNDLWKYDVATGQWAWVGGTQTPQAPPVYGTQGVASPDNIPSGRSDSAAWVDSNGDLWLFGGYGRATNTDGTTTDRPYPLNDVWKYTRATGEWTWISGSQLGAQTSVFGVRGVPNSGNQPGGRFNLRAVVDRNEQVWIMGGTGGGNELWCYNMQQDVWTWVHGNTSEGLYGIYGALGVPAPENTPGVRIGHATWLDSHGDLMLFGAYDSFGATTRGNLNDLWTLTPGIFALPAAVDDWQLFH